MDKINSFLNFTFSFGEKIHIDVKTILIILVLLLLTNWFLKITKKIVNKRLDDEDKGKFKSIFSFLKYFIYIIVLSIGLQSSGVELGVLLAGSAALLVGIGLGFQTLFQDIVSGIFIIVDKSLHVNDIVEIDGKIGKVFEIKLRTSRAVTIDDRVMIIPNHKFMTQSLFNWTQNGNVTTESVDVGVAYGSDVELVKKILLKVAASHPLVLKERKPDVLFTDFADSALMFRLVFSISDGFTRNKIKSDLRFAIDKTFREHKVQIPFPQRDVHLFQSKA